MRIFISWSGDRSGKLAAGLRDWLPRVVQSVDPWLSSGSIEAGERWSDEVARALEEMQCGIICLTPENRLAPWISFEAGALAKTVAQGRVIPYLLGLEPREVEGPLAQFQSVRADKEGTFALINAINSASLEQPLRSELLGETFDVWWPRIESVIKDAASTKLREPVAHRRSADDMLGEVLEILRADRYIKVPEALLVEQKSMTGTFGQRLRTLRAERGLTMRHMAYMSAVSESAISKLERDQMRPSVETAKRLATVLGVSLDALFGNGVG